MVSPSERSLLQPPPIQQRADLCSAPAEVRKRLQRVFRAADAEQSGPEAVAVRPGQPTVLTETRHGIGVENIAPDVRA